MTAEFAMSKRALLGLSLLSLLIVGSLWIGVYFGIKNHQAPGDGTDGGSTTSSQWQQYQQVAVATDSDICSAHAVEAIRDGGSSVDAAIVALLCDGVMNAHSMGIGGGFFMTVYSKEEKRAYVFDAREVAPLAASEEMYGNNSLISLIGGLAIAVPSEIIGYAKAHDKFGKLPWKDLFARVISLCRSGFPVRAALADAIGEIPEEGVIREMFTNPKTGKLYQEGEVMTLDKLAKTFEVISNDPDKYKIMYQGELAETMVEEIQEQGGIINGDDLANYTVKTPEPLQVEIDGMTMFSPPPPASGAVLSLILNILEGYGLKPDSLQDADSRLLTLHVIAEAFKHGYSKRSALGDPAFIDNETDLKELIANMTADDYAEAIRSKIWYNTTHDVDWYEPSFTYTPDDSGTSHVSVYANGDAVSVTSTINTHFGSMVAGNHSGIIYNNEMDDFSSPFFDNGFGLPPSPANFILPGKRPMSSMCPMILVDRSGQVRLVIGASGGAKITSSTAWVAAHSLWFGLPINEAIDTLRFHHQLVPEAIIYEQGFSEREMLQLREEKGHDSQTYPPPGSVVQAISASIAGVLRAAADHRKHGTVAGY